MGLNSASRKYSEEDLPIFTPMPWTLRQIREVIPQELFIKDTRRSLLYIARDFVLAAIAWTLATCIDSYFTHASTLKVFTPVGAEFGRWVSWCLYWWFQGLIFTGIWVIGHECGHGAFSDHKIFNNFIGFVAHTFLLTPYFSWRISHHRHHSNNGSMERDEVFVPKTREDLKIPDRPNEEIDWDEIFADTPVHTLYTLIRQQVLAFPAYFLFNASGQKTYPKWTNHFNPNSILFTKEQKHAVLFSNIGICTMIWAVTYSSSIYGAANVVKLYGIPWLAVTHWFVMVTFLQHTDPLLPHYRGKEWNFQRGAAVTVDRDFLGWQGRFFLHNIAHFHVVHHFFPKIPFYHCPEATQHLKALIGDHYTYSDKPVFEVLWENYNKCQFVENEGDVVFYRDTKGQALRRPKDLYIPDTRCG